MVAVALPPLESCLTIFLPADVDGASVSVAVPPAAELPVTCPRAMGAEARSSRFPLPFLPFFLFFFSVIEPLALRFTASAAPASTTIATLYHYLLGLQAPYPVTSLPVLLGTAGGLGLLVGPAGLLWLNLRRDPLHGDPRQRPMDRAFLMLLFLVSLTGLALLAGRETGAMAALLVVHLGTVMALFLTLPYGKFAHAVYRGAALLKYAVERRRPDRIGLGDA